MAAAAFCLDSPYAGLTPEELTATQGAALTQEREFFMSKLRAARLDRFMVENKAALVIQRLYKGYVLRRKFRDMREKLQMRKRIRSNLVRVTRGTAIVLGEKDRRARMLAKRHDAAGRIQGAFRCWLAHRWLLAERHKRQWEDRIYSVITLQAAWRAALARAFTRKAMLRRRQETRNLLAGVVGRLYRGYLDRQRVRVLVLRRQTMAAQRLQWLAQRFLARKALSLERQRRSLERRHVAAVAVQKLARGMIQRARVVAMRVDEVRMVREACALSIQCVVRGFLGRQAARYTRVYALHARAWACATHITRIARGFLGRRLSQATARAQECDLLIQARRGNLDAVVDLLDGFGLESSTDGGGGDTIAGADITVLSEHGRNSVLHLAAKFGHREVVTLALPKIRELSPQLIYARNRDGHSALSLAILHRHEQIALYILAMTASDLFLSTGNAHLTSTTPHNRGRTLLHDAARLGLKSVVDKLMLLFPTLMTGTERDLRTMRTPLHEALLFARKTDNADIPAEDDQVIASVLDTILSRSMGAKIIDAQDFVGFTALHMAAAVGNLRGVRLLLDTGADVAVLDVQQRTAWRVALLQGHEACFIEIRRHWLSGMGTPGASSSGSSEVGGLSAGDSSAVLVDAAARSRRAEHLHPQLEREAFAAIDKGDIESLRFLVDECDVSVNCREAGVGTINGAVISEEAGTPLLMRACESGAVNAVKFLLSHDEVVVDGSSSDPKTPLQVAIVLNHAQIADLLVLRGDADPMRRWSGDSVGERFLIHEAAARGFSTRPWLQSMHQRLDSSTHSVHLTYASILMHSSTSGSASAQAHGS
jgi:ankyrin repeat protein